MTYTPTKDEVLAQCDTHDEDFEKVLAELRDDFPDEAVALMREFDVRSTALLMSYMARISVLELRVKRLEGLEEEAG